jgi:hypothetical protein
VGCGATPHDLHPVAQSRRICPAASRRAVNKKFAGCR